MIAPTDGETLILFDSRQVQLWGTGRPGGRKVWQEFYKINAIWKIGNANHFSTILETKLILSKFTEIGIEREIWQMLKLISFFQLLLLAHSVFYFELNAIFYKFHL